MKKSNLVVATVLASVLGLGSAAAVAQSAGDTDNGWKNQSGHKHSGKRGGKRGGGKHMMKRMARQLSLTDDQKAQIKSFRETQKAGQQSLRSEMQQLRQEMRSLDRSDAAAVSLLATKKGELSQRMFIARNDSRQAFEVFLSGILTAEQQTKLAELKAERAARKLERQQRRAERQSAS